MISRGVYILVFVIAFCFASCTSQKPYLDRVDDIKAKLSKSAKKEDHLYCYGGGVGHCDGPGGIDDRKLNNVSIQFESEEKPDITRVRYLAVKYTLRFLDMLNRDRLVLENSFTNPITCNNVEFGILFCYRPRGENYIASVQVQNGMVYYHAWQEKTKTQGSLRDVHKETFEEAKRIVEEDSALN